MSGARLIRCDSRPRFQNAPFSTVHTDTISMRFHLASLSTSFQIGAFSMNTLKPGSHMSSMIGESLSVTIQGENSQRILLMSSHKQWSSPISATYENQA